jgi:hypothetical protein
MLILKGALLNIPYIPLFRRDVDIVLALDGKKDPVKRATSRDGI